MIKLAKLKKNNKAIIINLLVFLFLNHGILYYYNPNNIYNYSSPIKFVKYILILILFFIYFKQMNKRTLLYAIIIIVLFNVFHIIANNDGSLILILNYCFPILIICLYNLLEKYLNIHVCIIITYILATVMAYIEYFFMNTPFLQYADVGYRVCSNFINPNNFAAILWFFTICLIHDWINLAIIVNSCILLMLSGSRAGMLIFAIGILFILLEKVVFVIKNGGGIKKKYLIKYLQIITLGCTSIILLRHQFYYFFCALISGSRQIGNIDLSVGRFEQYIAFFKNVQENPLFPNIVNYVYTDNLYLHLWGFFGIGLCIVFILFNLYLIFMCFQRNQKIMFILLLLFFIYGFAENYLYLWPMAYIYWYLVCIVLKRRSRGNNKPKIGQ